MKPPKAALRRRRIGLAVTAIVASAIGTACWLGGVPSRLELGTIDTRFAIRGPITPSSKLAVIAIDDKTFNELQEQWPFPRSLHGKLIDRLVKAKVAGITYDVQFTEPTSVREDNALIDEIARASQARVPTVLGTEETDSHGHTGILGGDAVLKSIGAHAGQASYRKDSDDVIRRTEQTVGGLDSLAVVTARLQGKRDIALPDGGALIDFAGPPRTVPTYSFVDVLNGKVDSKELADKVAVVGGTAPSLQDVDSTSTSGSGVMSGPEIWANAITTIEDGLPLEDSPWPLSFLLIVALAIAVPISALRWRAPAAVAVGVGVGLLYTVACQIAFNSAGLVLPVVYPLIALATAMLGTVAVLYTLEAFERQRVYDTFARFVAPEVIDEVLEQSGGDLRSGAARRECTVVFTDLRGFTAFSEGRTPEAVIAVVNRYLSTMTDTIMAHGGSIVAYLGDGIMCVFGAPIEQADHADRALAAAREMLGPSLDSLNEWAADQGITERFRMGIGINSGEVMAGLVGSEQRVEFTTIGDTTNTAARLEGLTKELGRPLLLSGETKSKLADGGSSLERVGEHEIRGRAGKIELWSDRA